MGLILSGREEEIQELLDAGYSYNKMAKITGISDKTIKKLTVRHSLEIYKAFDEDKDERQLVMNFEWLYEEDKLDEICCKAYNDDDALLTEDLGIYVQDKYGDIFTYLKKYNAIILADNIKRKCKGCGNSKSITEYYRHKNTYFGLSSKCKTCDNKRILPIAKRYYMENSDRCKERVKKWCINNKDKVSDNNKRGQNKRRARKARLPDNLTSAQQRTISEYFNNSCALTGDSDTHFDHVIPIATGHGGTTLGNTIPLRSDLNLSKNDKNIFEWFNANRQRFELSQERFDKLIDWLSSVNNMTTKEYRDYVYWCHANVRSIDEGVAVS